MSEHNRGAWGGRDEAMWWPGDQQSLQHHQQLMQQQQQLAEQQQQQQQIDAANSSAAAAQQIFSYKMASSFQNAPTTVSSANSTSPSVRGYDYNGTTNAGAQWWYPPVSSAENMHNTLQSLQNSMQHIQQQQQQNMPPVQTPPPAQNDNQSRQEDAQRQQQQEAANRQHQEAVHRHHQQEAQRQHQEAIQQHQQAIAEAQARQHQLQQQAQQLQQQLHQQQRQQHLQNNPLHNNQQVLQQHIIQQHLQQIPPLPSKGRMPRAKADAKPRGRMTAYAFFVQTCREEHKKKHPEENVVFAEFSKKCAERWKTMLDKEKKRFQDMAENDKKRFASEMSKYTPPAGEKQRGKKRKQIKDPNAPKRSLSAFFWFSNDERGKVKAQNPEYGVGDIAKELGRRWADAGPDAKSKYEQLADKDKARYEKEMTAYKKKNNPALQAAAPVPEPVDPEEDDDDIDDDDDE